MGSEERSPGGTTAKGAAPSPPPGSPEAGGEPEAAPPPRAARNDRMPVRDAGRSGSSERPSRASGPGEGPSGATAPPDGAQRPAPGRDGAAEEGGPVGGSRQEREGSGTPRVGGERPGAEAGKEPGVGPGDGSAEDRSGPGGRPAPESGGAAPEEPAAGTGAGPEDTGSGRAAAEPGPATGRQRLAAALWPPRFSRAQLIVALLLFTLGLGLAIQVRSTSDQSRLRGARQEDLVRILDELDARSERLQDEKQQLEDQRAELENSSDQAREARRQTRRKADQLAVLAGTVAAEGPGITLTINDPGDNVSADMLLDTLQELRAAGAEAIQINDVRVVADTFFSDRPKSKGVEIDGRKAVQPYRFKVIGNPQDLEPALNIPGGVVQSFEKEQATVRVVPSEKIIVDALRPVRKPDYARSAPE